MALFFAAAFLMFYFIVLRPQQRQVKQAQEMRGALKNGDEVMTSGGIFGKVKEIEGEAIWLEIASKSTMKVARTHIVQNLTQNSGRFQAG